MEGILEIGEQLWKTPKKNMFQIKVAIVPSDFVHIGKCIYSSIIKKQTLLNWVKVNLKCLTSWHISSLLKSPIWDELEFSFSMHFLKSKYKNWYLKDVLV